MILKEYQNILFDILCIVDDICRKNRIRYILYGGTMLGAVRHHDFIPWDDDIDIIVWWKDYHRFCHILRKELPTHLRLVQPHELAPHFYDYVTRILDLRYHIHEQGKEDAFYGNIQNYICIDVFQFTYSGNTIFGHKLACLPHKILWGLAMAHRYQIKREKYTMLQKIQIGILSFAGARISMEKNIQWKEKLIEQQNQVPKKYCMAVNSDPISLNWIYKSKWYKKRIYMPFRGRRLPVPKEYDKHLTTQYGNYIEPVKDWNKYVQHFKEEEIYDSDNL